MVCTRLELVTSPMSRERATNCANRPIGKQVIAYGGLSDNLGVMMTRWVKLDAGPGKNSPLLADGFLVKSRFYFNLFLPWAILGCASFSRAPSSLVDAAALVQGIQQADVDVSKEITALWQAKQSESRDADPQSAAAIESAKARLEKSVASQYLATKDLTRSLGPVTWKGAGPWFEGNVRVQGIQRNESFEITDPESFKISGTRAPAFALEHLSGIFQYHLRLENRLPIETPPGMTTPPLKAQMMCDGPFTHPDGVFFREHTDSNVYAFDWYFNQENGQNITLEFSGQVQRCELKYRFADEPTWSHRVDFVAAEALTPNWTTLVAGVEVCAKPKNLGGASKITQFFWQEDSSDVSCPSEVDEIKPLQDPFVAFNEKIRSLTGSDLPGTVLKELNPTAPLDFSKAPHFDVIWVSALNFSADLYGAILEQALRYHADRGTQIRILIPKLLETYKDQVLLEHLQRGRPNVKLQLYAYHRSDGRSGGVLDHFQRVNHLKAVLGYSAKNPKDSFLVTGGRNVSDRYMLRYLPNLTAFPWLTTYPRKKYVYYEDFELKLTGNATVRPILAQLLAFWNRDSNDQQLRSVNLSAEYHPEEDLSRRFEDLVAGRTFVRHIVSVPYADDQQLEKLYVRMIDSAEREIVGTTPFFVPTAAISDAFHRASERGVHIRITTGLPMQGEDVFVAEDGNRSGINQHLSEMELYRWADAGSILHAKLLVVDDKLSFVSSVNLNGRSFTHDTEGGVLILNKNFAAQIKSEIAKFEKKSEKMTEPLKIQWFRELVIRLAHPYL